MVEVWAPGTKVLIADGEIPATVTAVLIRESGKITYEVVWWDKRSRICQWFENMEVVQYKEACRNNVGFFPPASAGESW